MDVGQVQDSQITPTRWEAADRRLAEPERSNLVACAVGQSGEAGRPEAGRDPHQ